MSNSVLEKNVARAIVNAAPQIRYVMGAFGCPCGARPESLITHPHVLHCGFEQLLELEESALRKFIDK